MLLRTRTRRATATAVVGALALTTALTTAAAPALAAKPVAKPAAVSVFPTDDLTVRDRAQLTGRRLALPVQGCVPLASCAANAQLNELDGFDLDPRLAFDFDAPVDPAAVAARITVEQAGTEWRTGVERVVYDPATYTVFAHPARQLLPATTYHLKLQGGPANKAAHSRFTTMSATDGLLDLRQQIENGTAFDAAGITERGLTVEALVPAAGTALTLLKDVGSATPTAEPVPAALGGGVRYAFGSYLAPSWLRDDVTVAQTPTRDAGPAPVGTATLPFVAVVPAGTAPDGGWPVAVYGHGFTRSTADVLLAAFVNAQSGIATVGTNVVGHGFGAGSAWEITSGGTTTTVSSHGRGVDQADAGTAIGSTEGSSATGARALVSSRDALRQTAADVMTLVRAVDGADLDADGKADLSGQGVTYFGQSFGGIYGTMVAGADPTVARSALNVPGGSVNEIARTSPSFRLLTTQALQGAGLLNSADPTRAFFQEQLPLRGEGPVVATVPGALAIQDFLARVDWLARSGSPETYAPRLPSEKVLIQVARGDRTVPNPTSYTLAAAGGLLSRTSLYRNDLETAPAANPHGFLLDLTRPSSAVAGQTQIATFLRTGAVIDPDGPGPLWEVPVADPSGLLTFGFPNDALRP